MKIQLFLDGKIDIWICIPDHLRLFANAFIWRASLANSPQARKRARQNDKRRGHNASLRSLIRTKIKQVVAAVEKGNAEDAKTAFESTVPVIDRMANRGIIKKNKAARHKARLNSKIKAISN